MPHPLFSYYKLDMRKKQARNGDYYGSFGRLQTGESILLF